jgi:hypothetical protein
MHGLRALLGFNQYTVVRRLQDERIIRESEVSVIEGKIGLKHLWGIYASYMRGAIEKSGHSEIVKEIMRTLLNEWEKVE